MEWFVELNFDFHLYVSGEFEVWSVSRGCGLMISLANLYLGMHRSMANVVATDSVVAKEATHIYCENEENLR